MDMNYWSCADMAHAVLGEWLSPSSNTAGKPRHLIFTSSVLAFYPIVGYVAYSPAKAALRSLSDTLSQELKLYGSSVKVHTVFPGSISTPGFEEENKIKPGITKVLEKDDPIQSADEVAEKSIRGLENGEYLVTVGLLGAAMRGSSWGGSPRNNWVVDTLMAWVTSVAWFFIQKDLDGKVVKYGKENGHPNTHK
jgi:3-dehydrosphinganine reductase